VRNIRLFVLSLFVTVIVLLAVSAESTTLKITSKIHPKYIIEEIKSKPSVLYFAIGKFYFKIGKLDSSLRMFEKAVQSDPGFAPAYHNLGVVYYTKSEFDSALIEFKKAVDLDVSYSKAYYSMGILYFELQDFDNAISSFLRVVELQPENANANFDLAQSYVARFRKNEENNSEDYADLEKALLYLNKTEELQHGFPHALNNIDIIKSIVEAREILLEQP